MTEVTDKAVEVMAEYLAEAHTGVRLWDLYTADTRVLLIENYLPTAAAALRSALPHLTDDGVAAPPADQTVQQVQQHLGSGVAAERATSTVAPSSPRPVCSGHCYSLTESGAGYIDPECPVHGEGATPAIDREALIKAIAGPSDDWLSRHQAGIAADRVLALIGRAS